MTYLVCWKALRHFSMKGLCKLFTADLSCKYCTWQVWFLYVFYKPFPYGQTKQVFCISVHHLFSWSSSILLFTSSPPPLLFFIHPSSPFLFPLLSALAIFHTSDRKPTKKCHPPLQDACTSKSSISLSFSLLSLCSPFTCSVYAPCSFLRPLYNHNCTRGSAAYMY